MTSADVLLFNSIPKTWEHCLPLGNGRLGAMVFANPCAEKLQLNEEGIWSGGPINRFSPDSKKYLSKIREYVNEGKLENAQELAFESMSGSPFGMRVYQTAGDFNVDFFDSKDYGLKSYSVYHQNSDEVLKSYESSLNLSEACVFVRYKNKDGVNFERKTWISAKEDMIFMYVHADKKGALNFRGLFDRGIWADNIKAENNFIYLEDFHGIPFCAGCGVVALDGNVKTVGSCLTGSDCTEALFFIDIQAFKNNGKNMNRKQYDKAIRKNYWKPLVTKKLNKIKTLFLKKNDSSSFKNTVNELYQNHIKEYKSYYDRMSFCVGKNESEKTITTPELLKSANKESTLLLQQYCNFSRYLLISSSRKPGILPATLQGIWNCYMDPPWGSKYTININLQMNYWCASICSLCETEDLMFDLLERTYENGCFAAKYLYGCNGFVIHHNTDYWGDCAVQDAWIPGSYWVLGGAWLSTHIYENYEYCQDEKKLERYYYLMHESCRFFVDFLQESKSSQKAKDGKPFLIINPSVSPENSYISSSGEAGSFSAGCEMDNMILRHLFESTLKASKILGKKAKNKKGKNYDFEEYKRFEYVLNHLKKPSLNKDGSLMEWNEEVTETEPGHRHISHLYGLFPGHTICVEKNPELAEAAKKTLEKRLKNGGGHTGWSQAWIINFRASLYEGNSCLEGIEKLFKNSTLPNLLDTHPPFQIDGNFGTLAGVMRMFVQSELKSEDSQNCEIDLKLLPSLPDEKSWKDGFIKGIRSKANVLVDMVWEDGKVSEVRLINENSKFVKINIFAGGSDKIRKSNDLKSVFHSQVILKSEDTKTIVF